MAGGGGSGSGGLAENKKNINLIILLCSPYNFKFLAHRVL